MRHNFKSYFICMAASIILMPLMVETACGQELNCKEYTLEQLRTSLPLLFQPDTSTIIIGGDFMMHRAQIENAELEDGTYSFDGSLTHITRILQKADIAIGNMEFTLGGKPYSGYPAFSAPETYPEYIAKCGIDIFLLANNHILDKGLKGAEKTLGQYRKMEDIRFTGCAGNENEYNQTNPLYLRLSGIKTAFINFTYGTNAGKTEGYPKVSLMQKSNVEQLMKQAQRDGAELIIVLPHWGNEYELNASEQQKQFAQWLADNGADIIIGSHPHVIQEMQIIKTKSNGKHKEVPVYYSTGNVISNMSAKNTRLGLLVELKVTRNNEGKAIILTPKCTYTWCTLPNRLTAVHSTIPVKSFLGKRDLWINPADYDIMKNTYNSVKKIVRITD